MFIIIIAFKYYSANHFNNKRYKKNIYFRAVKVINAILYKNRDTLVFILCLYFKQLILPDLRLR